MSDYLPTDMTYTHSMIDLFDERRFLMIAKGFQALFGNIASGSRTFFINNRELFEISIIRGKRRIAALIPRGISGTIIDQDAKAGQVSSQFSRSFPLSHEEDYINVSETLKRLPEENPWMADSEFTKEERMTILAAQKHEDQIRATAGLFEYLAAQSIIEGKMPAILGTSNADLIYDWKRDPDNIKTVLNEWNNGGDILGDIDDGCDAVQIKGKGEANLLLMGEDVWPIYLADDEVQKYHDNRRYNLAFMGRDFVLPAMFNRLVGPGGFQPRGTLITPKGRLLYLFSYDQYYEDKAGDVFHYMPKDQASILDVRLIANRYFGPSEKFWPTELDEMWMRGRFGFTPMNLPMPPNFPSEDIIDPRMFHFYADEKDKQFVRIMTQSAPVFATNQTDAVYTLKGLVNYP